MPIEFFTREGRGFRPKASIRKQGQIGFNRSAIEKFGLKDGDFFVLGFDKGEKLIALKAEDSQKPGVKRAIIKDGSGAVSAKAFLDYYGIDYSETAAYDLYELEPGILAFRIAG